MEGAPPPPPHVTSSRLPPPTPVDLLLSATLLAVTLVGLLFVLLILVVWLRSHYSGGHRRHETPAKNPTMDNHTQHFKVIIEKSDADDFEFNLPSDIKYMDEEAGGSVSPPLMKMKKSGGSSPKIPGTNDDESNKDSGESTPSSAKSKSDSKFVFPPGEDGASSSKIKIEGKKMKVALPEQQWILHRKPPLDWRGYNINIPKTFGLSDVVRTDLAVDLANAESNSRKYSATRSPSLEKDDKSPFPGMKSDTQIVFGFGSDVSKKCVESSEPASGDSSPVVQVRVQPLATDSHCVILDAEKAEQSSTRQRPGQENKTVISRRFGAPNPGLHINTTIENVNQNFSAEKSEVQNSPRLADSAVGKENNPSPRFCYSPKFFATPDSKSPKFFGTPDQRSPKFFSTPDSKSPAFFAENQSRNASPRSFSSDRQHSPRLTSTSSYKSVQSPLIIGRAGGECFRFDRSELQNDSNRKITQEDVDNVFVGRKLKADHGGQTGEEPHNQKTDLECGVTDNPQLDQIIADQDRLLNNIVDLETESVNSCPRIISSISITSSEEGYSQEVNDNKTESSNDIIVDTSHLASDTNFASPNSNNEVITTTHTKPNLGLREESQDSLPIPSSGNTANYRRQRLKSISLDSDNAKFIEQNLGIPIVKHLKHENLYDPRDADKSPEQTDYRVDISSPRLMSKASYFKFDDDTNDLYTTFDNCNDACSSIHQTVTTIIQSDDSRASPDILSPKKFLRDNSSAIAFSEMQPRFSPKEFDAFDVDERKILKNKNIRNLTIDINKRDTDLEKELMEYDCLDSAKKCLTPKTPTLKFKATSLDSSETLNLSLPQTNTLQVPQNSISVPNTPKRQLKRTLSQKSGKLVKSSHYNSNNCGGNTNDIAPRTFSENQQRKLFMNVKCPLNYVDSGIFLRENHANLMLFQASKYPLSRSFNSNASSFSRRMGSFDENMVDLSEHGGHVTNQREFTENRLSVVHKPSDSNLLGSNLLNFKQNLSVSSTNLKTLPEGVPSNDFHTHPTDEKISKKTLLQRRGSNQSLTINLDGTSSSLKYSTLSLQGSNLSLASLGASSHNLTNIKNSASNFSLNTDNRQKKNILERRNSNTSLTLNLDGSAQHGRLYTGSNCNLQGSHYSLSNNENVPIGQNKKCLLQRRGSNTSLTLNLQGSSNTNLNRCTSNSSLNIQNESKVGKKKGLLERRSSNTSLTLNINGGSNSQFDSKRVLSISNYNLDGSGCTLSRYNSNQSINNAEQKKGLLERRSSNTSLTLNLNSSNYNLQGCSGDAMRDIEIDETAIQKNLPNYDCYKDSDNLHCSQQREKHRKSLSTENLFPKSYKSRVHHCKNLDNVYSFGSHDNLWSNSYATESYNENVETACGQNLTYICGDQENEMIYAFGDRQHMENAGLQGSVPIKNITTKPLSPHSTSEDFKMYLANIQHLQNASNMLTRQQLKDLNSVFQDGYSKGECPFLSKKSPTDILTSQLSHLMLDRVGPDDSSNEGEYNPQRLLPEPVLPCLEYQKTLLRNLHQEFWDLPTNFQEKPMVFGSHPKNRYKTILPNEHSRVILRPEVGETDEGYINANYIKGHEYTKNCYIATQGPLQNTTYDFWLMVYQNSCQFYKDGCTKTNEDRHFGSPQGRGKKAQESSEKSPDGQAGIQKIVMLTNLIENGRQKCEKYFPSELNEEMTFKKLPNSSYSSACSGGSFFPDASTVEETDLEDTEANYFRIKNVGITHKTGYTVRKLLVEYSNKLIKTMSKISDSIGEDGVEPNIEFTSRVSDSVEIIVNEPQGELDNKGKLDEGELAGTNSLVVYHYWFDNWADHKCPKDVTALLDLSLDVMQNRLLNFDGEEVQLKRGDSRRGRPDLTKAKSFDKPDIADLHKTTMDKSMTYFDFSSYSKEKISESDKGSNFDIDLENAPRERRPSAFQVAKAFFDEVAKANTLEDAGRQGFRKNSLASRLDLPKNRHDLQMRRESTGRIDSNLNQTKKTDVTSNLSDSLKPNFEKSSGDNKNITMTKLNNEDKLKDMPPIIVHCSAGIGRTGCLIAILNGIRQMKADQRVDILGIVCNMRLNRGGMVQNSEQYELIHKVLCLYEDLGLPDVG